MSTGTDTTELPAQYSPGDVESRRYEGWVEAGYFTPDPASAAPSFTIVIPPPNVTGSLHIGHALDHTLIDALVRRRRMQGYNALWLPGMDHAGIATQNVVERVADVQRAGYVRRRQDDGEARGVLVLLGLGREVARLLPVLVTAGLHLGWCVRGGERVWLAVGHRVSLL